MSIPAAELRGIQNNKDFNEVVIPTLLKTGHSVLRYTDSGANELKFKELYKYNVVLIDSHMDD
jgi:hypothetical protein